MSMLAERKRKTKWVLNPTKKPLWTTDSPGLKLGKELMEKMGWEPGKGLGLKEQGMQEPLRVSYKNDTKGMGFKGNDEEWIEHQDEFNHLLSQLAGGANSSVSKTESEKFQVKSLEEKSRQSKARVHYQKFTRGKDLSRYSENDLACILGTGKSKKDKKEKEKPEIKEKETTKEGYETSFGVTTINSGSIQDYFKKKWTNDKLIKSTENNFEFNPINTPATECAVQEEVGESQVKIKKKIKRNHETADKTEIMEGNTDYEWENCEPKQKKKRKKEKELGAEENKNLEKGDVTEIVKDENSLLSLDDEKYKKRKNKKKCIKALEVHMNPNTTDENEKTKEKSSKKQNSDYDDTLEVSPILCNESCQSNVEVAEKSTKKKKKKHKNDLLMSEQVNSDMGSLIEKTSDDFKKKKEEYTLVDGIQNENEENLNRDASEERERKNKKMNKNMLVNLEEKKSKKRRKNCNAEDSQNKEEIAETPAILSDNGSIVSVRKKKKKDKKKKSNEESFGLNLTESKSGNKETQECLEFKDSTPCKNKEKKREECRMECSSDIEKNKRKAIISGSTRILEHSFGFNIERFKGSNLFELPGYGFKRNIKNVTPI